MYAGHFAVGLAIKSRFPNVQTFPIMLGVDTLFGVPDTHHLTSSPTCRWGILTRPRVGDFQVAIRDLLCVFVCTCQVILI